MALQRSPLGSTGLQASPIALGAGGLGDPALHDNDIERLLDEALELGVNTVDTAPSYGSSEVRLGRALQGRRDHFIVSSKLGYGIPDVPDWTALCIQRGIDRALHNLSIEQLDIAHLHSCPSEVLEKGEVVEALLAAVQAGKVRAPAYSGDAHALWVAVRSGQFQVVQATYSLVDRHNGPTLALAREAGMGTLAKRALANAPWRYEAPPVELDVAENHRRWRHLDFDLAGLEPKTAALRFAAFQPEVDSVLIGTRRPEHLRAAVEAYQEGPLSPELRDHLVDRWLERGQDFSPLT